MVTLVDLPKVGFTAVRFDPIRPKSVAYMEDRRSEAVSAGTPYWVAEYSTPTFSLAHLGEIDAFMMAVEDGAVFAAYDTTRPRPLAHLKGPLVAGAQATLLSVVDPHQIRVGSLPADFTLSPGDYVELRKSPLIRSLHRVTEAVTAAAGAATLKVRYAVDMENFAGATVHFEKPSCTMQIDAGSYSHNRMRDSRGVSFSATEVFFS